jgi:hypothetical protein
MNLNEKIKADYEQLKTTKSTWSMDECNCKVTTMLNSMDTHEKDAEFEVDAMTGAILECSMHFKGTLDEVVRDKSILIGSLVAGTKKALIFATDDSTTNVVKIK